MDTLFQIPEDFSALNDDELRAWIDSASATAESVASNASEFVSEERTAAALMDEMTEGVAAIEEARAVLASRSEEEPETETETETEPEPDEEPEPQAAISDEEQEALAELAARVAAPDVEPEPELEPEVAPEPEPAPQAAVEDAVVAAAPPAVRRLRAPARSRAAAPAPEEVRVALTAAAENLGLGLGEAIPDEEALARMMVKRRSQFGTIAEGTHGEKIPIAKADWSGLYPEERRLLPDVAGNFDRVQSVVAAAQIRQRFEERRKKDEGSLVASGGLCAPVTPYYSLQMLSTADRPVRAALASFNADRGGIQFARPAALTAVSSAVGRRTAEQDGLGGSNAVKTCQVIPCPPFETVDVAIIYHCLQFGNLGARTFPELVAQWNQLVLAAHAREAETALLDGIAAASTNVTADGLGLGASATLPSQIITAANGIRNRHRMDQEAVLRVMLPAWVLDLLVSDVYRTQFQRFEMTPEQFVALLRRHNVEPSFYIDGPTGAGQVFGAQAAAGLLEFPATIRWFIYPEGSFIYLDGGTLELGLVRDSTLNETNDFQIFGESFENVAFVGIESLEVTTTTCDSGTVSLPNDVNCPINY